jgi:hypothetical protein
MAANLTPIEVARREPLGSQVTRPLRAPGVAPGPGQHAERHDVVCTTRDLGGRMPR